MKTPQDFPRRRISGAVTGVQPTLLLGEVDGRYFGAQTDDEWAALHALCEDLAQHLVDYVHRKADEHPD